MIMNCTTNTSNTYTNSGTLISAIKASNEAFHKRLKRLYPCVDDVSQLPQTWSTETKASPLGLTYDNLGCYFRGNGRREEDEKYAAAARTDHCIPPSCLLYYFEIKFISKGREGCMGLGLTSAQALLTKLPGWARESYGYHADDGNIFNGDGRGNQFGPTFSSGDVIGCGYNMVEGKCFFTKNGINLGKAFDDIPSNISFYPTIGLKTPGEEIKANFGQEEFVYDIEQDLRSLRKNMTLTISNYPIPNFGNWQNGLHKLVQSWLLQNSYPGSAEAFTRSTKLECKENMQRIQQRNRIQQLVLNGRISEAIKLTNRFSPNLLQNNPNLLFALKCRQFIELISGAENDFQPIFNYSNLDTTNNNNNSNGINNRFEVNGDQLAPPPPQQQQQPPPVTSNDTATNSNHTKTNNGCNGMIGDINCEKIDDVSVEAAQSGPAHRHHQSTSSSSSLQELMDVDQPMTAEANNHHRNHSSNNSNGNNNHQAMNSTESSSSSSVAGFVIVPDRSVSNSDHAAGSSGGPRQGETSSTNKLIDAANGSDQTETVHHANTDNELDLDESKYAKLIYFGQELSDYLQQLDKLYGKNENNEKMLQDAISLIAFTNPKKSHFGKLLEASERERISQLLNSTILKAEMGDSYRPPLEEVMNHLKKLVRLNDSHGRWLVDRLY